MLPALAGEALVAEWSEVGSEGCAELFSAERLSHSPGRLQAQPG